MLDQEILWPTNVVKNKDKEKYVHSGYGITFDIGGSWSFDNEIEILSFLVLIIVHHLILTIARITF